MGAEVLLGAFDRAPLPYDLRAPSEANSFASLVGAPPFYPSISVSRGLTSSA